MTCVFFFSMFFFFQAEDGIRDLVRSRGLGDVYKRQAMAIGADRAILVETDVELQPLAVAKLLKALVDKEQPGLIILGKQAIDDDANPVSYTHLTLPTSDLV